MEQEHALLTQLGCFTAFFIMLCLSRSKRHMIFLQLGKPAIHIGQLIGLHLSGILWLGLVPVFASSQSVTGILFGKNPGSIWQDIAVALLIAITALVALQQSNRPILTVPSVYTHGQIKLYMIVRILFIVSCGLWFQGFLLWDAVKAIGIPMALGLTITLHTMTHIFSPTKDILAAQLFGFILSGLTLWTQTTWPAIAMQLMFLVVYEFRILFWSLKHVKQTIEFQERSPL